MDFDINQALDAQAFLDRVAALPKEPGVSLDPVLAPSIEQEAELRCLFAQDRKNDRLSNPYVGLISVFEAPEETGIRSTRARVAKDDSELDLTAKYVFPLPQNKRRKDFEPCVVDNLEEFQRNWAIFTEGSLAQLTDWNNVIAAGGSVLGCLLPLQPAQKESRRTIRKFYHSTAYPTSDIDLFLWGLTPEQAEVKINQIYEAVRDSVPWDVTCVRSKHAISIHSQYPYRSVQIVLRLYHSPAEILAGFDVDAPCVAYDGSRILANPRSIIALMRQANTVDLSRRSPSYEVRLAKYASRGFEVYVPNLRRSDIDPTIFERSLNRITGLARLLVLEKLAKPEARISYLESRRSLRSRVNNNTIYTRRMRHKRKGDLKGEEEIAGLDMNNYDVASLHIPYGPGWTAKRIEKLVYQTDLGMNSTFNPKNKNRRLHRHVGFFGIMKECIEDLCEFCPEPLNDEEKALQEEEDKQYIRGRISFIEDDPGRQSMTGSFNPIDIGEWSELTYLGPTEKFFTAIAAKDRDTVLQLLASGEVDVNRRDHVGRTALQVAALCSAGEICIDLIDAGARMTARLSDGRSALHVAAQMDLPVVVEKMLVRSTQNEEKAKAEEEEAKAKAAAEKEEESMDVDDGEAGEESEFERPSSEDDWSSEEDDKNKGKKGKKDEIDKDVPDADADIPEDNIEQPDILDVNLTDWDLAFTPLDYAVVSGSKGVIQALLNAGANPKLATKAKDNAAKVLHPLFLTTYISDDARAEEIIDQLLRAGASSAQADENLLSIFHSFVLSGRTRLVEKILRSDPSANSVLNVPLAMSRDHMVYPLVSAINRHYYSTAVLLLGYGAKLSFSAEDVQKVKNMIPSTMNTWRGPPKTPHELDYLVTIHLPMETALACHNYMVDLLIKLGAQVSVPIKAYFERGYYNTEARRSIVECVDKQISILNEALTKIKKDRDIDKLEFTEHPKTFAEMRKSITAKLNQAIKDKSKDVSSTWTENNRREERKKESGLRQALVFFKEMKGVLEKTNAKTYAQIFANYPDALKPPTPETQVSSEIEAVPKGRTQYKLISEQRWGRESVLSQQLDQYDALFEACWMGDNARIEELCLPRKNGKPSKPPIQIAAVTEDNSDGGPHTPFSVAILARKWDTARAVLAIATAQYKPKEDKDKQLTTRSFIIDSDSDSDSDDDTVSGCSTDMDVDTTGVGTITDLAKRDSSVQCDVSPKILINERVSGRVGTDGQSIICGESVIRQACYAGDLEAFVNITNMIQQLPEPEGPDMDWLRCAIHGDSPELVDEIIRRSGYGIDLTQLVASESEAQPLTNTSKLYLGLTVHGKKRKDLARYLEGHDNDGSDMNRLPMLWQAIENGAKKVIEYLSGSAPQAAYRYYATTKSTERAEALQDVDKQLPKLLGIVPNNRGENALTAVILIAPVKEKLPLAKKILALFPGQNYLQSTLAFTGWTALHLAVAENLEPAFFDYLLSNGLSAEQADKRGMNIYHFACHLGHVDLVKHLLKKLPEDINSYLLKQTTRTSGETPLMSAVENGQHAIVDELLSSGLGAVKDSLTMRDSKGSMPLHAAARLGFADIASSLIGQSTSPEAIYSENGVGETPLETAYAKWLISEARGGSTGNFMSRNYRVASMEFSSPMTISEPLDGHKLAQEVDLLKTVQANLLRDGKLSANEKLKDALDAFIPYLSEKAAAAARATPKSGGDQTRDKCDHAKTFKVVSAAASRASGHRRLVHLVDVQRSVQTSLKKAVRNSTHDDDGDYYRRRKYLKSEEIPDEAGAEVREKREMRKGIIGRSSRLHYWINNDADYDDKE